MRIFRILIFPLVLCLCFMTISYGQQMDKSAEMSKAVKAESFEDLEWVPCPPPLDFEGCHITILHGDPAKENSDVLFRMQPGTPAPEPWPRSAERMILISGEMHVTYEGEETQVMKAGTYAYGPSEKPHVAECKGKKPCVLFIAFEKPVDTFVEDH